MIRELTCWVKIQIKHGTEIHEQTVWLYTDLPRLPLININDLMWASLYRYIFWFLCHPVVKLKCYSVNKHQQHLPCLRKYWNFFNGFLKRLLTSPWFQVISLCLHQSHVLLKKKMPGEFCQNSWKVTGSWVHARC